MAVRSSQQSLDVGVGLGNSPVGTVSAGNRIALPGLVTYVCPNGSVQITVPSASCLSRPKRRRRRLKHYWDVTRWVWRNRGLQTYSQQERPDNVADGTPTTAL